MQEQDKKTDFNMEVRKPELTKADMQLWEMLIRMQGCVFCTAKGLEYTYKIKGGEMFVDRKEKSKSITKSSVLMAFHKALELNGEVSGPKKLGTFGASYLYPIFQRLEIIKSNQ